MAALPDLGGLSSDAATREREIFGRTSEKNEMVDEMRMEDGTKRMKDVEERKCCRRKGKV